MRVGRVLAALSVLAACGQPVAPDLRDTISRAQLDTVTTPLLLAEIPQRDAQATLIPWGENGAVTTWRTADVVSLSFVHGVVTGTRGLGDDLMSADVTGTLAALAAAASQPAGPYPRYHSYLDGQVQTVFRSYLCDMQPAVAERIEIFGQSHDVLRRQETCNTVGETAQNTYWIGEDGYIWQSRQWLGSSLGYLATETLVR